ncbi:AarF/UbiB family protein [Alloalcanivorax mobilis]|uniref:AarF/UbiB family protein n=1 Tax=Alloalcanivorax mobilis TaxID=2019569 RepID=UPI000B5B387F|nr:AarF/UbiB family protein [Alloalcanivorax mobilis]ASK32976.1 ubiquinone biosynthesis protein UbiB [Alcanivorax sp. N3-2A]ASK36794.1 ubiquinone biosynthesis protein UbiB [Alcanivorax sp. N3-2A]|tara:strand:- start:44089 stop:45705 length:1617 start_codon:yes stop_codon:yes gene_type:complete
MPPLIRLLTVTHVVCRYRLLSLLPPHPARPLLIALQYLVPSSWRGTGTLSEGERLQQALETLGPIFIKFGQLLATRRDMLPVAWTEALTRLQDRVTPFDGAQARRLVEQALPCPLEEAFQHFDDTPLASASVAQVHPATLADGTEVVVKVLRPGVERRVEQDLKVMEFSAGVLEKLWPDSRYFHPRRVVRDYQIVIRAELDLEREARNSETMRRHFLFSPLLHIPAVHLALSSRRVMVSDRIHGIPVNDIEAIRAAGIDPKVLAERGVEIFFAQVFRHNFFHADMHPGNIFVNPAHPESPQYMAVDCAIAGRLSRHDLNILGRMVLAVMREDYPALVDLVIRTGWSRAPIDRQRFEQAVTAIIEPVRSASLEQLEFAPLILRLFDLARDYHIEAPIQYILLMKTLVHIEGLGRSIYPQLDIWTVGRPLLEAWMMQEYGPTATARKLRNRLPEWTAQLPDMPDLLRDALENLRDAPHRQRELESHLADQLRRHRLKMIAAMGGLALGLVCAADVLQGGGPRLWPLAAAALVLLGAALKR